MTRTATSADPKLHARSRLARWYADLPSVRLGEMLRVSVATASAIFLTGFVAAQFIGGTGLTTLLASMGASAVILFAVPNSPMAGTWPLLGGHLLSGAVGIGCARWSAEAPWLAAAAAVGLSVLVMHAARCLHPPGGASALIPILGGEPVRALGLDFLALPLGLNLAIMWLTGLLYRRLLQTVTSAPALPATGEVPPLERLGIRPEDLHAALHDLNAFVDVSENELNEIYNLAAARAIRREFGALTIAQVMTRELVTVEYGDDLEAVWQLMQTRNVKVLPVIDRGRHVVGIITQTDFFRHARAENFGGLGQGLRRLLRPTRETTSQKPEVAGQIMTTPVITAREDRHITELVPILTARGLHRVPIVDERNKLVGLITQTDLIAALYRHITAITLAAGKDSES
ncbi:HPP family protein [Methylolobus aquaticus]